MTPTATKRGSAALARSNAVQRLRTAQTALDAVTRLRDRAIVEAREAGVTQKRVSTIVGLSPDTIARHYDTPALRTKNKRHTNKEKSKQWVNMQGPARNGSVSVKSTD